VNLKKWYLIIELHLFVLDIFDTIIILIIKYVKSGTKYYV